MNLTFTFESAELQFKQILEDFFFSVYDNNSLKSHGIEHHRRVWKYAKEITAFLARQNLITDPFIPFNLIIACYLHDIGMSVDTGIRHGHHSRNLCSRFLEKNNLNESDYQDVLLAIENHDNKEYNPASVKYDLLTMLSAADDLDAFGFIGIYRYVEIYLARNIRTEEIGYHIKENAVKRFYNFERTFKCFDGPAEIHTKKYRLLDLFFTEYNIQLPDYKFGNQNPSGYCGVVEILHAILQKKMDLDRFCIEPEKYFDDKVIIWYFKGLASELLEHKEL
jgi:HD superfamily phosphodiesterase